MPRPTHFEIQAGDPARAIKFYESVFGWSFQKWDGPMPYWMVTTGPDSKPGINGGLHARMGPAPSEASCSPWPRSASSTSWRVRAVTTGSTSTACASTIALNEKRQPRKPSAQRAQHDGPQHGVAMRDQLQGHAHAVGKRVHRIESILSAPCACTHRDWRAMKQDA